MINIVYRRSAITFNNFCYKSRIIIIPQVIIVELFLLSTTIEDTAELLLLSTTLVIGTGVILLSIPKFIGTKLLLLSSLYSK